jgi:branched-chain amino acid transport system permease protein
MPTLRRGLSLEDRTLLLFVLAAALLILPLIFTGRYYLRVLTQMAFFITFASAFGLLFGRTNQLFLCIAALAGLSAYTSGLMVSRLGVWHWPTIVIGAMLSSAVAAGLSYVSNVRRLGVVFVAILTLAFQLIFENMVTGLVSITGGDTGFRPPPLPLGPVAELIGEQTTFYYIAAILAVVTLTMNYWLFEKSRWGLIMEAVRNEEVASEVIGINVRRVKVTIAALAGFLIGLAGAFYGYFNGLIAPIYFSFASIDILSQVMAIFGGRGTVVGPLIGSAIFTYVNENIRYLGPISLSVYGVLLIVLFATFREGVVPMLRRWVRWLV